MNNYTCRFDRICERFGIARACRVRALVSMVACMRLSALPAHDSKYWQDTSARWARAAKDWAKQSVRERDLSAASAELRDESHDHKAGRATRGNVLALARELAACLTPIALAEILACLEETEVSPDLGVIQKALALQASVLGLPTQAQVVILCFDGTQMHGVSYRESYDGGHTWNEVGEYTLCPSFASAYEEALTYDAPITITARNSL